MRDTKQEYERCANKEAETNFIFVYIEEDVNIFIDKGREGR